jgi:hypothetical protein
LDNEARVYGNKGHLKLHRLFSKTDRLSFIDNTGLEHTLLADIVGNGYNYEAAEVMNCLDKGLIESPSMSLDFSIDLISVLDEVIDKATRSFKSHEL